VIERPVMNLIILAEKMKWTWQEMQNQPMWFINELLAYMKAKNEFKKKNSDR
jgi:hypothetical protein